MEYQIISPLLHKNTIQALTTQSYPGQSVKLTNGIYSDLANFAIGSTLFYNKKSIFIVCDHKWLKKDSVYKSFPLLEAIDDLPDGEYNCSLIKSGWSVACITLSDKGANGLREDLSGAAILDVLNPVLEISINKRFILMDEISILRGLIAQLAYINKFDLIVTTGGTGVGIRDITPQAIEPLIDLKLPGFSQAIMAASIEKTINAIISRQVCGIINKSLLISLPGSPKAVIESLEAIKGALAHTLSKINGDITDCGRH